MESFLATTSVPKSLVEFILDLMAWYVGFVTNISF